MSKMVKVGDKYPGVYYREAKAITRPGTEKVFYVTFKKDGKLKWEKVGRQYVNDMTAARAARKRAQLIEGTIKTRKEIREEEAAKKAAEAGKWTIGRLWEAYKENRTDNKALKTDSYRYYLYIKPKFEKKEPSEIVKLDTDRLRKQLLKNKSPQTVKHVLNLLIWIVNYGEKNGYTTGFKFKVQKPQVNNIKTDEYLTNAQLKKLIKAIDDDENLTARAIMKLALFTGMRRGELFKLEWRDVKFESNILEIRDPKGGPSQTIPLNSLAREILENYSRTPNTQYVFPGQDGKQRKTIQKATRRIRDRAGLPKEFRPLHGLRHAYASMLASSGKVDMYMLQKLLTHKTPAMTQRYAHLRDQALQRAAQTGSQIFMDAMKEETDQDKVINLKDKKER